MPPSAILKPLPSPSNLIPPLSSQGTFNVAGLSLPSRTTGIFYQQTGGRWGKVAVLGLGSWEASLQESGVRGTTRRGEAESGKGDPEALGYLAAAGGYASGFTHLCIYNGQHHCWV